MRLVSERGGLIGALACDEGDEVLAIADNGTVIRTPVEQIRATSRDTMGVSVMGLAEGQSVVAIARAAEQEDDPAMDGDESDPSDSEPGESTESTDRPGTLDESSGTDVVTSVDETTANPHAEDEERN
jgi:DNA gyrase subunit A